jgi:hypothetical protein
VLCESPTGYNAYCIRKSKYSGYVSIPFDTFPHHMDNEFTLEEFIARIGV